MKKFVATLVVFAGLGSVAHAGSMKYADDAIGAVARYVFAKGDLSGVFSIEKKAPVALPQDQLCQLASNAQEGLNFFQARGYSDEKISSFLVISADDVGVLKQQVAADYQGCGVDL